MRPLETNGYYALGAPLYFALMAAEYLVARRKGAATLSFANSVGNLSAGIGTLVVGLFLGPCLLALYELGYARLALVHWPAGSWAPWLLALLLTDFGRYWHHRLEHRVAACWAVHGVHHMPEEMNFTVAVRHAWFSDLYAWPFYILLPLAGVPTAHFFLATAILSLYALFTHSEHYDFPGLYVLVTPRSHTLHHATNPRYLDKNFGAVLCIWDRLFGTYVAASDEDPPHYGTLRGYETHDGALAQWVLVRDLLTLARAAPTWKERLRVFYSRPGHAPPGVTLPRVQPPRCSAEIPRAVKLAVSCVLLGVIAGSLYVFLRRDQHTVLWTGGAALALGLGLLLMGALLDGRLGGRRT